LNFEWPAMGPLSYWLSALLSGRDL
jgi:hypothetical protein